MVKPNPNRGFRSKSDHALKLEIEQALCRLEKKYSSFHEAASAVTDVIYHGKYNPKASEKNVHLMFMRPPNQELVWELLNNIPEENRIDLGNPLTNPELYSAKHYFDNDHLSHQGALLYTRLLTEAFLDR